MQKVTLIIMTSLLIAWAFALPSCGPGDEEDEITAPIADDDDINSPPVNSGVTEQFRNILPHANLLTVGVPGSEPTAARSMVPLQILDRGATFPERLVPAALGINELIANIISSLRSAANNEPTSYNERTREIVWGPIDFEYSAMVSDFVALYVRDEGPGAKPFRYTYRLIRGDGPELDRPFTMIWGGVSPKPDTPYFQGVLLVDLLASLKWEQRNSPQADETQRGRFAAFYAFDRVEHDGNRAEATVVLASFRDFLPPGAPVGSPALDAQYFFGEATTDEVLYNFVDFTLADDLYPGGIGSADASEKVRIKAAFFDQARGRAEIIAAGGNIPEGGVAYGAECWDDNIDRVFYAIMYQDPLGGNPVAIFGPSGNQADCVTDSLDWMPSADDIDSKMLRNLDYLAGNGPPPDAIAEPLYTGACTEPTIYPGKSTGYTIGSADDSEISLLVDVPDYLRCCESDSPTDGGFYCELSNYRIDSSDFGSTQAYSEIHRLIPGKAWAATSSGVDRTSLIARMNADGLQVKIDGADGLTAELMPLSFDVAAPPLEAAAALGAYDGIDYLYFGGTDEAGQEKLFDQSFFARLFKNTDTDSLAATAEEYSIDVLNTWQWGERLYGVDLLPTNAGDTFSMFAHMRLAFELGAAESVKPLTTDIPAANAQ